MLIKRIELKNFRYVEEESLDLPLNELFILLGKNGSSKSTFLWAVPFCLYGFSDWTLKNTLKWGKKEGYVKVFFEVRGNRYLAKREFNRTSSSFSLYQYIDGELTDIGGGLNKEAEEELKNVFPVPLEVFLRVVTRVQTDNTDYQLGSFCNATSKGMYDTIKHFIEVVKIEKYANKNDVKIKELKEVKTKLESAIETSEKSIEDLELKEISEEEIADLKDEVKDLKEKLDEAREKKDEIKQYNEDLKEYEEAVNFIDKYSEIEELYPIWDKLKNIEEPEYKFSEAELGKSETQILNKKQELEKLKSENERLKNSNEEELIKDKRKELEELTGKQSEYLSKKKQIEEKIELLQNGKCPKCGKSFRSTGDRISEKKSELAALSSYEGEIDDIKERIEELENEKKEKSETIEANNKAIVRITNEIGELKNKLTKMENSKDQTERWEERQEFISEYPFEKSPDKVYRAYQNMQEVPEPEKVHDIPLDEALMEVERLSSTYIEKNNILAKIKDNKEKYDYHKEQIEESTKKLETVESTLSKHLKLSKIYSRTGAPHFMIKEFLYYLQHFANEYLDRFTNGRISIEFQTNHESKSKPIELIFYDAERNNSPRPYSTFSRGEKTRVALSIEFLGLGKVFAHLTDINIETGLIDEVYGLDEEGQQEFAEILSELSGIRKVMGGVVCFEAMAENFEKIIKVEDGKLIKNNS